jgi:hypothetical protein
LHPLWPIAADKANFRFVGSHCLKAQQSPEDSWLTEEKIQRLTLQGAKIMYPARSMGRALCFKMEQCLIFPLDLFAALSFKTSP